MKEEWKDIKGLEGYYQISNLGNVKSIDREVIANINGGKKILRGKPMKLSESVNKRRENYGYYLVVNLRKNGKNKVWFVHRLVAEAFINNPNKYPIVNHIDGNKHNNKADNLEWCTYAHNNIHALNNGLRKPRGASISQINIEDNKEIATYRSISEASRITGINRSAISHCATGRNTMAGGYYWSYK